MALQPLHLRPKNRGKARPEPAYPAIVEQNAFTGLVAGCGLVASLSAASALQSAYPAAYLGPIPLAGLVGLLTGWTVAWPVARLLLRMIDSTNARQVAGTALGAGMLMALPIAFFGVSIGSSVSVFGAVLFGGVVGICGLVWGDYLDFGPPRLL